MKIRGQLLAVAAILLCSGALAVAVPSPVPQSDAALSSSTQRPGDAYQNGYARGMADAQSNVARNSQPSDQWTTEDTRRAYREGYDAGYAAPAAGSSAAATGAGAAGTAAAGTSSAMASAMGTHSEAARFGYDDGLAAGRKDRDGGHSFRPTDSDMYKDADHGWTSDFGDKDHYRQLYRQSYSRGYQDGYGAAAPR